MAGADVGNSKLQTPMEGLAEFQMDGGNSEQREADQRKERGRGLVDSNKVFRMAAAANALWMNMPESRR